MIFIGALHHKVIKNRKNKREVRIVNILKVYMKIRETLRVFQNVNYQPFLQCVQKLLRDLIEEKKSGVK